MIDSETLLGVFVGLGLSAAAGLRLFVPLLAMSAASLSGHLELSSTFDWIGTREALIGFAVAAVLEIGAYLIPFLDNALDVIAAPAAGVAGTVLMASSVVEMSPFLKWTLAIVAGGGIAGTVQLFTSATRLASTATTAGLANPAVSVAETGSSAGLSVVAIVAPVVALVLVAVLLYIAVRALVQLPRRAVSRRVRRTQGSS